MDFDLTNIFGGPMGMSLFGGPGGPVFGGKTGGAGQMFGGMSVPGMPATGGMMRAGDDDMQPAASPPPGGGLLKAGLEQPPMAAPSAIAPPPSLLAQNPADQPAAGAAVASGGGGTPGAFVIPSTGQSIPVGSAAATTKPFNGNDASNVPPGQPSSPTDRAAPAPLASPAGSGRMPDPDRMPSAVPTATIPNSRGGPDERGAPQPVPIVPPKIDTSLPTAGGGTVGGQTAPPPAAATPPAAAGGGAGAGGAQPNATGASDKFREWLSKTGSISGKPPQPLQHKGPGAVGAAHIPQGGAQLLQSILDAHAKSMPKPQPAQLPPGLLRRFQGA